MQYRVSRRNLKSAHEDAVLRHFGEHLQSKGIPLHIVARPDPPEAVVDLGGQRTWIEITDAFLNSSHAKSLTSKACADARHVPDGKRFIVEPDLTFSSVLHSVIEAKYDKASMHSIASAQGPGILLVGIFTPFKTAANVACDEALAVSQLASSKSKKVFRTIYAYEGSGLRTFHVIYREA